LNSLREFSVFTKAFRDYRTALMKTQKVEGDYQKELKLSEAHEMISDFLNMIMKEKDRLRSE
jgi:hypothetical protein